MIEEISIRDLGVIRSATVPLHPGLTVITGETGAGKTMLLTGLGLLMGGKADPASVRPGSSTAVVEGRMHLPEGSAALERVLDAGGALDDDGSVVVARSVAAEGRSRAHLGGRSVPQAVLADVAADLVTVHGQSDQVRLRTPSRQRAALDEFAGPAHAAVLEEYRASWAERVQLVREIDELTARAQERAHEAELLRLGLAEVERVDPQPGEDVELQGVVARLGHAEELRGAATLAHGALVGDDSGEPQETALVAVDRARRALEQAAGTDPALGALAQRVAEVEIALGDVASDVAAYQGELDADPARLEQAHARLAELTALARAHGGDVETVLVWSRDAGLRLLELDDDGEHLRAMTQRAEALGATLDTLAARLTEARTAAAERLGAAVSAELDGLAMTGARLVVDVDPAEEAGAWGADTVTMSLVPHPGAPARALGKGASGGELSRVMLGIEVALASSESAGGSSTFIFDEVDAGVGGRAAVEVGRRLAALARHAQVVVVTHLAQVAAFADSQLVVSKASASSDDGGPTTVTGVSAVTGDDRVAELARMLSGQADSSVARQHALELLEVSVGAR
ncbi:DNA replication and repair protein RecN [Sediminihabitans luteus]|uniref:DNA repair protein RecN n=1 Tax=Sediminihabitans luteus TaxID=1138585 RepID=A0A2M9CRC1_9CELL|nr:DNA repair protein RecN [Sediminihabitans luteus]PJJ74437.1 DNA replication and repair protein RecN [Sediminihabitans luteus]GIJ00196.1 DNA repair protein RecN [Sediminihabitans luteus]